jgi:hypothetical protein
VLDHCRDAQCFVRWQRIRGDVDDAELASYERAGLIEDDRVDIERVFLN